MKLTLKEIKIPQSPRARKLAMQYYVYRAPKSWSKKLKTMQGEYYREDSQGYPLYHSIVNYGDVCIFHIDNKFGRLVYKGS